MVQLPLEALELAQQMDMENNNGAMVDASTKDTNSNTLPVVQPISRKDVSECRVLLVPPTLRLDNEVEQCKLQLELEMTTTQKAALNNGTSANYNYLESYIGYQPFPLMSM